MSHDIFNASSTATWIECSWSAWNALPEPLRKAETIAKAEAGTEQHIEMQMGDIVEIESFVEQLENPPSTVREFRVKLTDNCGGTIDIFAPDRFVTTILDGKFGKWDVPAKHNMQLMTYGAAALPLVTSEWFRFVIYQPNGLDDDPWKQWVHHRSEIEAHKARVLRAIQDRSAPKPGPWCRWCKAFQVCPAMSTDAGFVMGAMSRRPEDLTTQELVRLLRLIRALGDVKPVYEEALTVHLKMGRTADGSGLKPMRSFRSFNDEQQAAEFGYLNYGAKGVRPLTPAQLEKQGIAGKQYVAVATHKPPGELKAFY